MDNQSNICHGCIDLIDGLANNKYSFDTSVGYGYNTSTSQLQTVNLSDSVDRFFYKHAENKCYNCIVSSSENYDVESIIDGKLKVFNKNTDEYEYSSKNIKSIRKAYLTVLARERYDLYRSNGNIDI